MEINLKISGMHCGSCAKIIKMELEDQAGVDNVSVDFDSAKAALQIDLAKTDVGQIKKKIVELGYSAAEDR